MTLPQATAVDLDLALAFHAVLVRHAPKGTPLTYGELVDEARALFPDNETVRKAIPVSVGRRLDFVRAFAEQRGLPDLTALVVSKVTGECGAGFNGSESPEAARARISAFDWTGVAEAFAGDVEEARTRVLPPKSRSKPASGASKPLPYDKAAALMSAYYMANKSSLPADVRAAREKIIDLIRAGASAEDAFGRCLAR